MTALETVRQLRAHGARPPISVRFVDWADEEGARFGRSLLGSSACAGTLVPDDVRELTDAERRDARRRARRVRRRSRRRGRRDERLDGAVGYLELHIEQGPVLLDGGRLACAVSGTFGVERHLITFTGQAAHAGSTPMRLRQDSLAAAARAALEIRESAIAHDGVATVGRMDSTPGRDHGRRGRDRDAARPAPPRPGRARGDVRRGARGMPERRRGSSTARSRCATSSAPPRPRSTPELVEIARASDRAGRRRRRRSDPERSAARRDRDRPGRPDGDDLRAVGPADLARGDREFLRAGARASRSTRTGGPSTRCCGADSRHERG